MSEPIIERRHEDKMTDLIIDGKIDDHSKNCKIHKIESDIIRHEEIFKLILYRLDVITKRLDYTNWIIGGIFIIMIADVILYLLKIR